MRRLFRRGYASTTKPRFLVTLYKRDKLLKLFLLMFVAVLSDGVKADSPYELPRSTVIELKEPESGRIYPLFIQVPPTYIEDSGRAFPVVYLTDAHYSFPLVSGATRFPMNSGAMEPVIIVGISYSKGSEGPSSRIRDFTPTKAEDWKYETGGASGHTAFIREVVFPYIEKNYRASAERRTFVGNSLGGLLGAHVLLTQPDMFSSYIIGSPSVWFDGNFILSVSAKKPTKPVSVYLSVGELEKPLHGEGQDMVSAAQALNNKLLALKHGNMDLKFSIIPHATHETAFPTTAIQGLHWIYGVRR